MLRFYADIANIKNYGNFPISLGYDFIGQAVLSTNNYIEENHYIRKNKIRTQDDRWLVFSNFKEYFFFESYSKNPLYINNRIKKKYYLEDGS